MMGTEEVTDRPVWANLLIAALITGLLALVFWTFSAFWAVVVGLIAAALGVAGFVSLLMRV